MPRTIVIIFSILILAACAPVTPAPASGPVATTNLPRQESWTIRFTQSGGIMGMLREIEITSDGQFKTADDRTGRNAAGQLTDAELSRLQDLVNNLAYTAQTKPSNCADCFIYTLEINSSSGKPFTAQTDDMSLEASGLMPLVEYLRTLMAREINTQG